MLGKRNKPIYYTSLDELSIYNWSKLHLDNDWTYLVKSGKYDRSVYKLYKELLSQFEHLNVPTLRAKKKVLIEVIGLVLDIAENSSDIEKLEKASKILRAIMISGAHSDWLFNVDFTETSDQRAKLTRIAVAIKAHEELLARDEEKKGDKRQTLNDKIVNLEQILGVKIDPKDTSVLLFAAYERMAIDKQRKNIN